MSEVIYFPGLIPSRFEELQAYLTRDRHAAARIADASSILGTDLLEDYRKVSLHATSELAREQWMVHASIQMVISMALVDWLEDSGAEQPVLCGGQSLGAWVAAVYAGVLTWPDALKLTFASARIETEFYSGLAEEMGVHIYLQPNRDVLDALIAESPELELSLIFDGGVYGVAGPVRLLGPLAERLAAAGGRLLYMANRIEHCAATRPLRDRMETELCPFYAWHEPRLPVLSEIDGTLLTTAKEVHDVLLDTMVTPLRWARVVAGMRAADAESVYVIGNNNKNMFHKALAKDFTVVPVIPSVVMERDGTPAAQG